jgi:glucose/arabinose dehydrogenase
MHKRFRSTVLLAVVCAAILGYAPRSTTAAPPALEPGFARVEHTTGLNNPVAFAFEGERIYAAERDGTIRVIKPNGKVHSKIYKRLKVSLETERGLLGIAVDPKFEENKYVYVYYTIGPGALDWDGQIVNRLSRFTTERGRGKHEKILFNNIPSDTGSHDGGALFFGPDGKLYLGVGDGGFHRGNGPLLDDLRAKVFRLRRNGKAPANNPFVNTPGADPRIYAHSFRNPFRGVARASNSTILIGDVGEQTWEEIDSVEAGADYGWYRYEGPCWFETPDCDVSQTDFGTTTGPIHAYRHNGTGEIGGTIILGAFPGNTNYPEPFKSALFYGDWVRDWVHVLYLDNANHVTGHADFDEVNSPVDFETGPDGNVYVLSFLEGILYKYIYVGN